MSVESYKALRQLRNHLLLPYILLVIVTIAINGVLYYSANRLNAFSRQNSADLIQTLINNELGILSRLTGDYSNWYETIEKLALHFDPVWAVSNLQVYLRDHFNVSRVLVINPDLSIALDIEENRIEQQPKQNIGPEIEALLKPLLVKDAVADKSVNGLVTIQGEIYLVAASILSPDVEIQGMDTAKQYGLLLFAKHLVDLLPRWGSDYQLGPIGQGVCKGQNPSADFMVELSINSGKATTCVWLHPKLPGEALIDESMPWIGLFALFALGLSLVFVIRINFFSRSADRAVNELWKSEQQYRVSERRLQEVISGARLGYWDWDYQTGELSVNQYWLDIFGLKQEGFANIITDWFDRVHPEDREELTNLVNINVMKGGNFNLEYRIQHISGNWRWVHCSGSVVEYDEDVPKRLSGTCRDISDRKAYESWLKEQATHDYLTGLYNRVSMERHIINEIDRARRYHHILSICMIDIDFFKKINDTYGHQCGDLVLRSLADLFKQEIRQIDLVARYGGEEFVMVLPETTVESAIEIAERLRQKVELMEIAAGECRVKITISVGIGTFPGDGEDYDELLKHADTALYVAKDQGRNRVCHVRSI